MNTTRLNYVLNINDPTLQTLDLLSAITPRGGGATRCPVLSESAAEAGYRLSLTTYIRAVIISFHCFRSITHPYGHLRRDTGSPATNISESTILGHENWALTLTLDGLHVTSAALKEEFIHRASRPSYSRSCSAQLVVDKTPHGTVEGPDVLKKPRRIRCLRYILPVSAAIVLVTFRPCADIYLISIFDLGIHQHPCVVYHLTLPPTILYAA